MLPLISPRSASTSKESESGPTSTSDEGDHKGDHLDFQARSDLVDISVQQEYS